MPTSSTAPRYLLRWDFSRAPSIQQDVVVTTHRLAETPIGSDQRLRQLLRQTPNSAFAINTMGQVIAHSSEWQTGCLGNVRADEAIELIQQGRLWMTAKNMDLHHPQIAEIVDRLVAELSECHVGLRIRQAHADLFFSSPSALRYYGIDPTPTVMWHLAGRSRIWLYPRTSEFIDSRQIEPSTDQRQPQSLYYEPAFEQQARVLDVEPGQMVSWPHLTPYRIENVEGVNVALRMSYQTPQSMRLRNIRCANQLLRKLHLDPFSGDPDRGLAAALMDLIGGTLISHRDQSTDVPHDQSPTFCLEASVAGGTRSLLDSRPSAETHANVAAPLNTLPITPAASVVMEN